MKGKRKERRSKVALRTETLSYLSPKEGILMSVLSRKLNYSYDRTKKLIEEFEVEKLANIVKFGNFILVFKLI